MPAFSKTQFWDPKRAFRLVGPIESFEAVVIKKFTLLCKTIQFSQSTGLLQFSQSTGLQELSLLEFAEFNCFLNFSNHLLLQEVHPPIA